MGNCSFVEQKKFKNPVSKSSFKYQYPIGKGAFGKVWKIELKSTKQKFALKEILKVKVYEKNSVKCVQDEKKFLSHLNHPFIINMHYSFQDRENLYIVLDYLSGGDLRYHICKRQGQLFSFEQANFFLSCVILAVEYLHFNHIMHRDIKPENLVFDEKGYLYLTDLGIAKVYKPNKQIIDSSGTPGYMSPEVILNQNHDPSTDFFALGVMLHEFVFGRRPYTGKSRKEIKEKILSKEIIVGISDIPIGWPIETADLINRLLKRRSNERIGKRGITEIKSHPFFKNVDWELLYQKKIVSPFIPENSDNFDKNYCNKNDDFDEVSYNLILEKVNSEYNFSDFYFNIFDKNERDHGFEYDGNLYFFLNPHENKNVKHLKIIPTVGNVSTNLNHKQEGSIVNESISYSPNNM